MTSLHDTEQQPCSAAVDESVLSELLRQLGDDEAAMRDELIDSYLTEATVQVDRFATAAAEGDIETARAIAHSLRSASALLGALQLACLLSDAEEVAVTAPTRLGPLAQPVQAEFRRVAFAFIRLRSGAVRIEEPRR